MTKAELKHEFSLYFADLKANARAEGFKVSRELEWQLFIDNKISQGEIAADWEKRAPHLALSSKKDRLG